MLLFDPAETTLVIAAPGHGAGYWAGAPSATADASGVHVGYRLRAPRPSRGYELRIASSNDGRSFHDVWRVGSGELGSASIERASLVPIPGGYRLYISYVDPSDDRWCIDLVEAERLEKFDARARRPALRAADFGLESVKDPVLLRDGDEWLMFTSFGSRDLPAPADAAAVDAPGDALATGRLLSCTGLATSADGIEWRWAGPVLVPEPGGWDAHETRLATVVRAGDEWVGLYDGIADISQNYEERTGLATSTDLREWTRQTTGAPLLSSPAASGSFRYAAALDTGSEILVYHEVARADGAHELRLGITARAAWARSARRPQRGR
ncbi:MAG: hypothetical protein ABR525_09420 [Candidatus Limnocylindria bacterium]